MTTPGEWAKANMPADAVQTLRPVAQGAELALEQAAGAA